MPQTALPRPASRLLVTSLAVGVGVMAFLFALQKIYDPDTWWHLATGRWVIEHRLVPAHDIFSFATSHARWISYSWLPATGMYLVDAAGGPAALVLAKAVLVAGAFVLAFLLAVRAGLHPWLVATVLALTVPMARFQFRERPQVLMFLLVAVFFWLLAEPGAERRPRTWIVLGLAQVLWANVHGSFILGIAMAGALLCERIVEAAVARLRRRQGAGWRPIALSAGLLALVAAASLVNAYGAGLLVETVREMTSLTVKRTWANEEFQPLSLRDYPHFAVWAVLGAASFAAAGRRARPFAAAVFAGFAILGFGAVRFAAIAALVFAFVLALNLQPLVERAAAWLGARGIIPRRATTTVLAVALVAFAAASFHRTFGPGREYRFGVGVNEGRFPGPAVGFLSRVGFEGNLFNSWALGGYALWLLPKTKDLVDGRAIPAHLALLDLLQSLDRPALERWLAAQDVRGALLTRDDPWLDLFAQSPRYARAFADDRAVVFLRADVAASTDAAALASYRFIRPEESDPSYLLPIARGPQAADAEAELRRAVADAPGSFRAHFLLGFFLEARGKPEALDHYLEAARISPGLAFAHNDLGRRAGAFAAATGQSARVEPLLRAALELAPEDPVLRGLLGVSLYAQKRLPEAEASLRRALAKEPDLPVALLTLGYLLIDTNRPAEAVPLLRRARAATPSAESPAYGLALALHALGDRAGAAAAWRDFLSSFPASAWAPRARQRLAELGGR